jgi:5-aminolevulinate synthase
MFNYVRNFQAAIAALKQEQRYRVFSDLERKAGQFPQALWSGPSGKREVVVWCLNDYLGMGQHPKAIEAMCAAARTMGAGAGRTRNISGKPSPNSCCGKHHTAISRSSGSRSKEDAQ